MVSLVTGGDPVVIRPVRQEEGPRLHEVVVQCEVPARRLRVEQGLWDGKLDEAGGLILTNQ